MSTAFTDEQLADLIGVVAIDEFRNAPDYAKPELIEWISKLRGLTDDDLYQESRHWIYESANVSRFRMNFEHLHCRATACFYESRRRLQEAGHNKDCAGPSIYSRAHADVMRDHGYLPSPEGMCTCEGAVGGAR